MWIGFPGRALARVLSAALAAGLWSAAAGAGPQQVDTGRVDLAAVPAPAVLVRPEPFAASAAAGPVDYRPQWAKAAAGIREDAAVLAACRTAPESCPAEAGRLLRIVEENRGREGRALLGGINRAVNLAIAYASDRQQHGLDDVWSAPLATFASGRGDCEDYALAKYLALREAGVAAAALRLLVVESARGGRHAVLAAWLEGEWLVLDNRRFMLVADRDLAEYQALAVLRDEPAPGDAPPAMLAGGSSAAGPLL